MMKTTIFKNNKTQAVRIPKELAFSETIKMVTITKKGNSLILTPVEDVWDEFFDSEPAHFPERDQSENQERDFGDPQQ